MTRCPGDGFFVGVSKTLSIEPDARKYYLAYEQALSTIDQESWETLQEKAIAHFIDHREGQQKQGFFNQLNDAFAYEYLIKEGCKDVRVLREGKGIQSDIEYTKNSEKCFCEVKTMGISDAEIEWRAASRVNPQVRSSFQELFGGFLRKLKSALDTAGRQIKARGGTGLIYIVVHFDDIAFDDYWDRCHEQILGMVFKTHLPQPIDLNGHQR